MSHVRKKSKWYWSRTLYTCMLHSGVAWVEKRGGGGGHWAISLRKGIFSFPSGIQLTTVWEGVQIEVFTEELAFAPPAIYSHPIFNSRPGGCKVFPEERAFSPLVFFDQIYNCHDRRRTAQPQRRREGKAGGGGHFSLGRALFPIQKAVFSIWR